MSSLVEHNLYGVTDYVDEAIKDIRKNAKLFSLCLRFSGGKDSIVAKRLMQLAGVPFETRFSRSSVDPPEVLKFIKRFHPDVLVEDPRISMFQLIIKKGFPPTRVCRYCCKEYKERNTCPKGDLALTATGVRRQESPKRLGRRSLEYCHSDDRVRFLHPILDWSAEQVWEFIELERLPYPGLYDEGFERIGCVGCPLASEKNIRREFARWPNFEKAYLWAFERMLEGRTFDKWKNKFDVMEWYCGGVHQRYKQLEGQICMFDGDFFDHHRREDYDDYWNKDITDMELEDAVKVLSPNEINMIEIEGSAA